MIGFNWQRGAFRSRLLLALLFFRKMIGFILIVWFGHRARCWL
jgi:hypothetical protein